MAVTFPVALREYVEIPDARRLVRGQLVLPRAARGIVLFAHGSGSGRHSPRNQFVARVLEEAGLGTVLVDLLEEDEAGDRHKVFDIELLARRLMRVAGWLAARQETAFLPLGLFGASTGAAAALTAAAKMPDRVRAVVSRGGRPDLAAECLHAVHAPTLLIVGGDDDGVIELNEYALDHLSCPRELVLIPGATHLFEEPGALEEVARLARDWFLRKLSAREMEPGPPAEESGRRYPRWDADPTS